MRDYIIWFVWEIFFWQDKSMCCFSLPHDSMCVRQNHKNSIFCLSKLIKSKWVGFSYSPNDGKFFLIMFQQNTTNFFRSLFIARFLLILLTWSWLCVCIYFSSRVNHGINWFYLMRHDKISLFIAFFHQNWVWGGKESSLLLFGSHRHQHLSVIWDDGSTYKKLLQRLYRFISKKCCSPTSHQVFSHHYSCEHAHGSWHRGCFASGCPDA